VIKKIKNGMKHCHFMTVKLQFFNQSDFFSRRFFSRRFTQIFHADFSSRFTQKRNTCYYLNQFPRKSATKICENLRKTKHVLNSLNPLRTPAIMTDTKPIFLLYFPICVIPDRMAGNLHCMLPLPLLMRAMRG
jgi:hypothetical protein